MNKPSLLEASESIIQFINHFVKDSREIAEEKKGKDREMKHKIEFDEKCKSCKGTGIYVGLGERDGSSVVCHTCRGTGCHHFFYEYEDFERKGKKENVKWIVVINPGICIVKSKEFNLSDFGGMPYEDWFNGKSFPLKSENRKFSCPAWWYQSADYDKKPDWQNGEVICGWGTFSACKYFPTKNQCWDRWDKEFGETR